MLYENGKRSTKTVLEIQSCFKLEGHISSSQLTIHSPKGVI